MSDINHSERLETWADAYLKDCELIKGCSHYTLRLYRQTFRVWGRLGYGLGPENATAAILEARTRGLAASTVNNYLRVLRAFWRWLHKRGVLADVPHVQSLPEPRKVKPVFDTGQAVAVLRVKVKTPGLKRIQALFALAIDTGLRYGELVSLRRQGIDGRSMLLSVDGKVGQRRVPISAEGLRWLTRHVQSHGHDRVFCSSAGTLLDHANATRELRRLFELAGVPVELAQFHHIRRYALREYVGVAGLRGAQLLAGHSKPETTLRYLDADAELRSLPHQSISPLARLSAYRR
jgi:site-specific recombinase XerC